MKKDKHVTKVIFRYWFPIDDDVFPWTPGKSYGNGRIAARARKQGYGEVIALFPEIPTENDGRYCQSYQHIGQHCGAGYHGVISTSVPATKSEYKDLKKELEKLHGYNLKVVQKRTHQMREEFNRNVS